MVICACFWFIFLDSDAVRTFNLKYSMRTTLQVNESSIEKNQQCQFIFRILLCFNTSATAGFCLDVRDLATLISEKNHPKRYNFPLC